VETKHLKRQVKRNIDWFLKDFMFQLSTKEFENLRGQFGTSSISHSSCITTYTSIHHKQQYFSKKTLTGFRQGLKNRKTCCRGRVRTFTRQLAVTQSSVVDPGRSGIATGSALFCVYPVTLTPETRGHVCQKISSPHNVSGNTGKNLIFQN